MRRRDMTIQVTLVLALVCGIVGGNFLLHRWVIGNAASREAGADTTKADAPFEDLDEFAPRSRAISETEMASDPAQHRNLLRKLVVRKLPALSSAERDGWVEELSNVSLREAEGILDLRSQVGAFPVIDESATPRSSPAQPPEFNFSIDVSR